MPLPSHIPCGKTVKSTHMREIVYNVACKCMSVNNYLSDIAHHNHCLLQSINGWTEYTKIKTTSRKTVPPKQYQNSSKYDVTDMKFTQGHVRRSCKLHPMLLLFLDELRCNLASGGRTLNHSIAILQGLCEMQDVEVVWIPYSFWAGLTTDLILVLPAHSSTPLLTINLIHWLTNKSFPLDNPQSKPSIITYPYSLQWSFQTIGHLYENCIKKRHVTKSSVQTRLQYHTEERIEKNKF